MKSKIAVLLIVLSLVCVWFGCNETRNPAATTLGDAMHTSSLSPQALSGYSVPFPQTVSLLGFTVYFDNRVEANNQTTFYYHVVGPGEKTHFTLELPSCAGQLAAYDPITSANFNVDPNVGIVGIEWQLSSGATDVSTHYYSITFPGSVRTGIIQTAVKSNSASAVGMISGPCARVYDISGTVFSDANSSHTYESTEAGIAGVTIYLFDGSSTLLGSVASNASGQYVFETLPAGTYTLQADTNTVTTSTKTKYLSATTLLSLTVTVGPNSLGNNFGFDPRTTELINDIKFGTLPTNGKSAGYWKKQFQSALSGGKADYTPAALLALLNQVAQLQLTGPTAPFNFPNGLQTAYDILNNPTRTDVEALKKQLLATELNHVVGKGIFSTDPALQLLLIGWGEAIIVASGSTTLQPIKGISHENTITATAVDAEGVFSRINSGGGGGTNQ